MFKESFPKLEEEKPEQEKFDPNAFKGKEESFFKENFDKLNQKFKKLAVFLPLVTLFAFSEGAFAQEKSAFTYNREGHENVIRFDSKANEAMKNQHVIFNQEKGIISTLKDDISFDEVDKKTGAMTDSVRVSFISTEPTNDGTGLLRVVEKLDVAVYNSDESVEHVIIEKGNVVDYFKKENPKEENPKNNK